MRAAGPKKGPPPLIFNRPQRRPVEAQGSKPNAGGFIRSSLTREGVPASRQVLLRAPAYKGRGQKVRSGTQARTQTPAGTKVTPGCSSKQVAPGDACRRRLRRTWRGRRASLRGRGEPIRARGQDRCRRELRLRDCLQTPSAPLATAGSLGSPVPSRWLGARSRAQSARSEKKCPPQQPPTRAKPCMAGSRGYRGDRYSSAI